MATIRDRLLVWKRTHIDGPSAMTRNTEAYNHMQTAFKDLLDEPWVNLTIQSDMNYDSPATTGKATAKSS